METDNLDPEWIENRITTDQSKNLKAINSQMIEVMNELAIKIPLLTKLEDEYNRKFYRLLLQAGETNMAKQEASAKLQLSMPTDDNPVSLFDRMSDAKLDVRILLTKKEMLIEIGRNLRAMR